MSVLGQWERVAIFLLSDIVKNQFAQEGAQSMVPVIIPLLLINNSKRSELYIQYMP